MDQDCTAAVHALHALYAPDPLHPDLLPYCTEIAKQGHALRHPLVYQVPFSPELGRLANLRYAEKQASLAHAYQEHDWASVIRLHERPYRWQALAECALYISDAMLAPLVTSVWTDTENAWQCRPLVRALFQRIARVPKSFLMDEEDLATYERLPAQITCYRGSGHWNRRGWSWTLDQDRAAWFARRAVRLRTPMRTGAPVVQMLCVPKGRILFFTMARNESEIVLARPALAPKG